MANLKNTEIDDNLELPSGTTGERPSSPEEGQIRYNTDLETAEFYNGENWRPLSDTHPEAEGGTVVDTDIGGVPYRIHLFTETGTDTLTVTNPGEVEYLIVAGGGGGARQHRGGNNGGGGAGGVIFGHESLQQGTYTVDIGDGGLGQTPNSDEQAGENTIFLGKTAIGGGPGNGGGGTSGKSDGGSGGGSGGTGGTEVGGIALQNEGFGNNGGGSDNSSISAGGGGGAGEAGGTGTSEQGGNGGNGLYFGSILGINLGDNGWFAAGAGGTHDNSSRHGQPGLGGAGVTPSNSDDDTAIDALKNTGSGGGAAKRATDRNNRSGNGGSGIVIVRYPRNSSLDTEPDRTVIATQPNNFQTVRDGLVLELDAGNPISYPGTGTTWRDLSGTTEGASINSGFNFEINQFGYFYQDNAAGASTPSTSTYLFGAGDGITCESWVFPFEIPTGSPYQAVLTIGGDTATSRDRMFQIRLTYEGAGNFDSLYRNSDNSGWNIIRTTSEFIQSNQWYHLVSAYTYGDGGSWKLYINGEEQPTTYRSGDGNDSPIQPNTTQAHIGIGEDGISGEFMPGRIAQSRIYRKQLTDQEIRQNFNATRSRYGI